MATAPDSLRRARPLLGTFVEIVVPRPARRALCDTEAAIAAAFGAVEKVHRLNLAALVACHFLLNRKNPSQLL